MTGPHSSRIHAAAEASRQRLMTPLGLLVGAALVVAGCGGGGAAQQHAGGGAVPVRAAAVTTATVPLEIHAIGNVVASSTVNVNARIGGQLQAVHFKEGDEVTKGQLLFTIDPRPFEAALARTKAQLARDQAQLENARADVRRYEKLVKESFVTQEQYDQAKATADALAATVDGDRAAIEEARLQLEYTTISAPIAGRTGNLLVHAGNLIKANDKTLVVINRVQPIDIGFSVPEQYLGRIRERLAVGNELRIRAASRQGGNQVDGTLAFVDNAVDESTGTVLLKGTFTNLDESLWPGEFVDVWLRLGEQPDAVVVPTEAVQSGQEGTYVWVVKRDGTAEQRPVTVDREYEDSTVIAEGVQAGEQVVTDGQLRLTPGAKVDVKASLGEQAGQQPGTPGRGEGS